MVYERPRHSIRERLTHRFKPKFVEPVNDLENWWVACWHDPYGDMGYNPGYMADYPHLKGRHTGIDLNRGYGDADRGQPVYAISHGVVTQTGFSEKVYPGYRKGWLGVVVVRYWWRWYKPIYVRYAHLEWPISVSVGTFVWPRRKLGVIGNYGSDTTGDHCHHDMKLSRLYWDEWLTPGPWVNPVEFYLDVLGFDFGYGYDN